MSISRYWRCALHQNLLPRIKLQIKHMNIVKENLIVLASENHNHIFINQICAMSESGTWQSTLIFVKFPLHFFSIKDMDLIKHFSVFSFSSKNIYLLSYSICAVKISRFRRLSFNRGLNPLSCIQIQYMKVVQVLKPFFLILIEVSSENKELSVNLCHWMSSSRSWRNSCNLRLNNLETRQTVFHCKKFKYFIND